jgi:flagellar basal body-associated protein FliL
MENEPTSLFQNRRLVIIIAASVVGLFIIVGSIVGVVLSQSRGTNEPSQYGPPRSVHGTMNTMFFTRVAPELQDSVVKPSAIPEGDKPTGLEVNPGQPLTQGLSGKLAGQPSAIVGEVITAEATFFTRRRIFIIVAIVSLVAVLAIAGGATGYIMYKKKLEQEALGAQGQEDPITVPDEQENQKDLEEQLQNEAQSKTFRIIIVSGVFIGLLSSLFTFFLYRKNKNKRNEKKTRYDRHYNEDKNSVLYDLDNDEETLTSTKDKTSSNFN